MQLNLDCIRDILLEVEKYTTFNEPYDYDPDNLPNGSFLSKYDSDTVMYHIRQCDLSGYLLNTNWTAFDYVCIEDLTPEGHSFVANTRTDERWKRAKGVFTAIGGFSLKLVSATAEGITTAMINKFVPQFLENP